ncbi:MAG TPA: Hpt domain-containing protein [Thermoanaerobaculia bacterium]|nr:Hpt domain-containing protein [Thermoanaerobaculia bacterium]
MIDPELEELKREFLAEAREKVRVMEEDFDGGANPQSIEQLSNLAHQLKGAGGSYGFERISSEAAQVERALEQVRNGGAPLRESMRQNIARLRGEIDQRLAELSVPAQ